MRAGMAKARIILQYLAAAVLAVALAAGGLAAWALAPCPVEPTISTRTAIRLLRAPFADRIVIGDSRVSWAKPTNRALLVGYGSATFAHLERVTGLLCRLSDADIVIALGANDTKPSELNVPTSLASLERMLTNCAGNAVTLAEIWPTDPAAPPYGKYYDVAAIAEINAAINVLAAKHGASVIPAPALTGHTIDGVHFDPATSRAYIDTLAAGHAL